jgi:hypothetical protein
MYYYKQRRLWRIKMSNVLTQSESNQIKKNICKFCNNDCTFISFSEECCVPCADRIQSAGWKWVIDRLIEGDKQVEELHTENYELKRRIKSLGERIEELCETIDAIKEE